MKIHYIIVLGCLIALLSSTSLEDEGCSGIDSPSNYKDCNGKLSKVEEDAGYKYCCYIKEEGGNPYCEPYTKEDYDKIKDSDDEPEAFRCYSSYLKKGLLYLVLFSLAI